MGRIEAWESSWVGDCWSWMGRRSSEHGRRWRWAAGNFRWWQILSQDHRSEWPTYSLPGKVLQLMLPAALCRTQTWSFTSPAFKTGRFPRPAIWHRRAWEEVLVIRLGEKSLCLDLLSTVHQCSAWGSRTLSPGKAEVVGSHCYCSTWSSPSWAAEMCSVSLWSLQEQGLSQRQKTQCHTRLPHLLKAAASQSILQIRITHVYVFSLWMFWFVTLSCHLGRLLRSTCMPWPVFSGWRSSACPCVCPLLWREMQRSTPGLVLLPAPVSPFPECPHCQCILFFQALLSPSPPKMDSPTFPSHSFSLLLSRDHRGTASRETLISVSN